MLLVNATSNSTVCYNTTRTCNGV